MGAWKVACFYSSDPKVEKLLDCTYKRRYVIFSRDTFLLPWRQHNMHLPSLLAIRKQLKAPMGRSSITGCGSRPTLYCGFWSSKHFGFRKNKKILRCIVPFAMTFCVELMKSKNNIAGANIVLMMQRCVKSTLVGGLQKHYIHKDHCERSVVSLRQLLPLLQGLKS